MRRLDVPDSDFTGTARTESPLYALVTAVRNEAERIGATIETVADQTLRPVVWAIVSDGSTDSTDAVLAEHAERYPFIRPLRIDRAGRDSFAAKSRAVACGYESIRDLDFDFLANLDADMKLPPGYYERVIGAMTADPEIGIAGGCYLNVIHGRARPARSRPGHVPGAIQVFRRECWDRIGGYPELSYGGEDTAAELAAEMAGWKVLALPEMEALHGAPDQAKGLVKSVSRTFRSGAMDYHLGYSVGFMGLKAASRLLEPPAIVGSLARLAGFAVPMLGRVERELSPELRAFLRRSQKRRFLSLAGSDAAPEAGARRGVAGRR